MGKAEGKFLSYNLTSSCPLNPLEGGRGPMAPSPTQGVVVDYFLAKPFSKDAILEVIAQLCPTQEQ